MRHLGIWRNPPTIKTENKIIKERPPRESRDNEAADDFREGMPTIIK